MKSAEVIRTPNCPRCQSYQRGYRKHVCKVLRLTDAGWVELRIVDGVTSSRLLPVLWNPEVPKEPEPVVLLLPEPILILPEPKRDFYRRGQGGRIRLEGYPYNTNPGGR